MDCFCLFLEFSQIGSGIRQVPCPPPTTKDCRGYVNLCQANVAYGADQAGRIIIASILFVVLGAETPHVATLTKVLWTGVVEMVADLVVQGLRGWGAHGCRSIGVVSFAVNMVLAELRRARFLRPGLFASTMGWVIVAWQCAEIWTITVLSLLKYTFVTITSLPLALRRRVPGRTSLICIPPERLAKSEHPERHVCPVFGCPDGSSKFLTGGRAVFSRWIWSGLNCTYLSVSLNQIKTTRLLSLCVTKPCTTPKMAGPSRVVILSPSVNPGPVLVHLSLASKGCMKVSSAGISKAPWVGKLTMAMRSPRVVQWDVMMPSSPSMRSG